MEVVEDPHTKKKKYIVQPEDLPLGRTYYEQIKLKTKLCGCSYSHKDLLEKGPKVVDWLRRVDGFE